MRRFVIEVFPGRNAKKAVRHSFDAGKTVTIGRSYGCDLVIDDPYVSAEHVTFTGGETLQVKDLNAKNGTRYQKQVFRDEAFTVSSGDKIQIGHTTLAVYAGHHAVQPARKLNWAHGVREVFSHPVVAALMLLFSTLAYVAYCWLFFTGLDYFEEDIYTDIATFVLLCGGLAIVLYSMSLQAKHVMRFSVAVSYATLSLAVVTLFEFFSRVAPAFILSPPVMAVTQAVIASLSLVLVVPFIAYLENGKVAVKNWIFITVVFLSVLSISVYDYVLPDEDTKLKPQYEVTVPVFAWEPRNAMTVDAFLDDTAGVFKD